MWTQWNEQREYMDISWGCGWFLATMFVVINLLGQLGGVGMVMTRFKVEIACGVLFFIVVLQVNTLYKQWPWNRVGPDSPRIGDLFSKNLKNRRLSYFFLVFYFGKNRSSAPVYSLDILLRP